MLSPFYNKGKPTLGDQTPSLTHAHKDSTPIGVWTYVVCMVAPWVQTSTLNLGCLNGGNQSKEWVNQRCQDWNGLCTNTSVFCRWCLLFGDGTLKQALKYKEIINFLCSATRMEIHVQKSSISLNRVQWGKDKAISKIFSFHYNFSKGL